MSSTLHARWVEEWHDARHILCIRLDALGDVVMTGPALRALRAGHPQRHITLLTSPQGAAVARLMPEIDRVIEYAAPWMKATPTRHDTRHERHVMGQLRAQRYDAAVIFTVCTQSPLPAALLTYLAGIPRRLAHCRENPYQLLTHWLIDREAEHGGHEVQRQLDLVAAVGARCTDQRLAVRVPITAVRRVQQRLVQSGSTSADARVVVHPGASAPARRYPAEHFATAARLLHERTGCTIIFTGSAAERELIETIRTALGAPSISLAGELDVAELAATIALCDVLVVNNTGPAHIAAALGTPVVDLYAQTNLQHTPWQVESRVLFHDVPCRGCLKSICPQGHHDCLRRLAPERVAAAAAELLQQRVVSVALRSEAG